MNALYDIFLSTMGFAIVCYILMRVCQDPEGTPKDFPPENENQQ